METGLLKKLQGRTGSSPKGEEEKLPSPRGSMAASAATPMTEISSDSVGVSSKLMKKIKEGREQVPSSVVDLSHLDEATPTQGRTRFHAGKRVDGEAPEPQRAKFHAGKQLQSQGNLMESRSRTRGHVAWGSTLRMMEDIGWEVVLDRVRTFVRGMSLTEVAQKFQPLSEDLTETILQSWRDAGIHKEDLISSRLQTVPEVAAALVVYVNEFQQEK